MKRFIAAILGILLLTMLVMGCNSTPAKIDLSKQEFLKIVMEKYPAPTRYNMDTGEQLKPPVLIVDLYYSETTGEPNAKIICQYNDRLSFNLIQINGSGSSYFDYWLTIEQLIDGTNIHWEE